MLPSSGVWSNSVAVTVDSFGDVYGFANGTLNNVTGTFAVEWSPTLTWNNAGGPGDGRTWDVSGNQNWTNGNTSPAVYSDGSSVIFNDSNSGNHAVTLNTTVNPAWVVVTGTGDYVIGGTGTIGGTGSLTKSGSGMLTLSIANTYSGGTNVTDGLLEIMSTSATTSALPAGALTISGSGEVQLAANVTLGSQPGSTPASNVNITSLSITDNGTLDITNNHIIINYGSGPDPISSIAGYIGAGYANGTWNGPGIDSSAAATNPHYGIGYADGADNIVPGLSSGQIEIKYTLYGDADLDGSVTGNDFTLMAGNLGKSGKAWDQGDFDYDGSVTGNDFTLLTGNLGKTASGADITLPAADYAAIDAFAAANGLMADVPEPATMGIFAAGAKGVLLRRRRNGSA